MDTGLWKSMPRFGFGRCLARSDEGRPRTRRKWGVLQSLCCAQHGQDGKILAAEESLKTLLRSPPRLVPEFFLPIRQPRPCMRR